MTSRGLEEQCHCQCQAPLLPPPLLLLRLLLLLLPQLCKLGYEVDIDGVRSGLGWNVYY